MSLIFKKKQTATRTRRPPNMPPILNKANTIRFMELSGVVPNLAANSATFIIDYQIPDWACAEVYAIGARSDIALGTAQRKTKDLELYHDEHPTDIRFAISNYVFGGYTGCLPFGNQNNSMLLLDYLSKRENLTPKYNSNSKIRLRLTSDEVAIDKPVYAKLNVLLYEKEDSARIFGATIDNFANILPGGVLYPYRRLFADYAYNKISAGVGDVAWETLYSKQLREWEHIQLTRLGYHPTGGRIGATNFKDMRLLDNIKKKWFPDDPPYWVIAPENYNFSIGGDVDIQPLTKLPKPIYDHIWNKTTLAVQYHDNGAAVAAYDCGIQLLGTYYHKGY